VATEKAKQEAREYVAAVRAATYCARCGKQPVDFHHPEHIHDHNRRIGPMMGRGCSIAPLQAEIKRCEPLCRSCHMKEDGRLPALLQNRPMQRGTRLPPKPCTQCGQLAKPLRRGLCNRCNHRQRAQQR
jgi:hypothetical protein